MNVNETIRAIKLVGAKINDGTLAEWRKIGNIYQPPIELASRDARCTAEAVQEDGKWKTDEDELRVHCALVVLIRQCHQYGQFLDALPAHWFTGPMPLPEQGGGWIMD